MSPKEQAIWKECSKDFFWKRGIPFSLITPALIMNLPFTRNLKLIKQIPLGIAATLIIIPALRKQYVPTFEEKFLTLDPHGEVAKCKSKSGFSYQGCIHLLNTRKYCDNTRKYCGSTHEYWVNT